MTLAEAFDGRTTEQRWDWVLSRLKVADIGKDEARQARRLRATSPSSRSGTWRHQARIRAEPGSTVP
ncbi:hypothetical protein [Streptomyces wuyuanensis]|uniref:hypothetical protein n=1 Tax=Streptomyces wuyuanensis TaxID=1196353 RepID=UPI003D75327B